MYSFNQCHARMFVQALLVAMVFVPMVAGQDPQVNQLSAPPPFKAIGREEKTLIDDAKDSKNRLRLTIDLADSHLSLAEKYTAKPDYEAASREVGIYHALIENALSFLASLKRDSNKTRDLYKRLEMSLRADGPRLTSMRRTTPLEFAIWIKEVEDFARDGRTESLNSFYGHTVVRESDKPLGDPRNDKPKEAPTPKVQQP